MRPQTLPEHKTSKYLYTDTIGNNDDEVVTAFIHGKDEEFPILMHVHDFYEINIVLSGKGYHYIGNQAVEANAGSVYVIPPEIKHGYYTDEINRYSLLNILIKPSFIKEYRYEFKNIPGYEILFEIEPQLRNNVYQESFFLSLTKAQLKEVQPFFNFLLSDSSHDVSLFLFKKGILISLISKLSEFIQKNHEKIMNTAKENNLIESTFILKTIEYMNNNYYQNITIEELASLASMSRSTYIRRFKTLMSTSPLSYLILIRLKQAKSMLKHTDKSIADISLECGFFDHSHFSKTFKSIYSLTPNQYRKEKRK